MFAKNSSTGYAQEFWSAQKTMRDILGAPMTRHSLALLVDCLEKPYSNADSRLIPTSFNADDPDLRAVPRTAQFRWQSLEDFLKTSSSRGLVVRTPLFWQAHFPAHNACRVPGIPYLANDPDNMPVGAAALLLAGVDTVLTEATRAHEFWSFIEEKKSAQPVGWFLVHEAHASHWNAPASVLQGAQHVFQEVHIMPGAPILEQCSALAAKKAPSFHRSDSYEWRYESGVTFVTAATHDAPPIIDFECPWDLIERPLCACGRPTFSRI